MWGLESARRAWRVAAGTPEAPTNRIGSPLSAAQPAAGIAYAGLVADAITTSLLGCPETAETKRSMPAASVYGSLPLIAAERMPLTVGTAPMRMT